MLKFKLLWALAKRNFMALIFIGLSIVVFKFYWDIRQDLKASERREHNLKSEMINQWREDSLAKVLQAEIIDSLEGVVLSYMNIKVKTDTVIIFTTGTLSDNTISFDYEDDCYQSWGWVDITPPYPIQQFIYQKPYSLEIMITNLSPNIYGKVTPSNSCVQIGEVQWKVSPDIKGACRDGFDKGEFFLGTGIGAGIITILTLLK